MAWRLQSNLYILKVEDALRRGISVDSHEVSVGPVAPEAAFSEHALSLEVIEAYDDLTLRLRFHELWAQFCLFRWYFEVPPTDSAQDVAYWPVDGDVRCAAAAESKEAEIAAMLWRLKFEQRCRSNQTVAEGKEFARHRLLAQRIPMTVFGTNVELCTGEELLVAAVEYAAMLAAIRWIQNANLPWNQDGLMDVPDEPF